MTRATRRFLVADIGGTHARFALAEATDGDVAVATPSIWLTAIHESLDAALDAFLKEKGRPRLDAVAVCAAGPVEGEGEGASISMTNCPWEVSAGALARATGVGNAILMNDFAALALAVPELKAQELHRVGGGKGDARAPIGILGPGTGLGVASLVPDAAGHYIAVAGEGGHVDLAPTNAREISVVYQLMQEYGRVSAERVLSGPGLVALYMALGALDGSGERARPTGMDISNWARLGKSAVAKEAISLFCGWLGAVAGDLALTLGAKGGIFIGGGIVPGWIADGTGLFDAELFRHRFEAKGRFGSYLAPIPVYVIMREDAALLGLAHAAAKTARGR